MGEAWLTHPFSLAGLVAAGAYTRSPLGGKILPLLLVFLNEPNAYNRLGFLQSVEKILGRKLSEQEFSLTGLPETRKKQVQDLLKRYARR